MVLTNLNVYLTVAEEAAEEAEKLSSLAKTPKPDGQPGFVISYDLSRKSFKQSLIAITFSGMYLEALFGIIGIDLLGSALWKKIERHTTYEEKLALLGFREPTLLADCKRFREARNDLIHEKAVNIESLNIQDVRNSIEEAALAIKLIQAIKAKLNSPP